MNPIRAIRLLLRRWTLASDLRNPSVPSDLPTYLRQFTVGEVLPWKGVTFRVGKVIAGEVPMVILTAAAPTRGRRLRALRDMRDAAREVRDERRATEKALRKAVH